MTPARRSRTTQRRSAAAPFEGTKSWWCAALVVIAGMAAYANSLSGPFIFDDRLSVVENTQIRDLTNLASVLSPERELPTAGRPLVNLAFAVNYAIGGLNVTGYHVANVALHLLCALLVFGIVGRTLERAGPPDGAYSAGLAVALVWVVHPLNTEAVDYVTQRTELMMALCYLITLYASMRGRSVIAVVACAAGMACKESMVTAPLMVVAYDAVFSFGSILRALRARWRLYAGLAASWIVLAVVMRSGPRVHSAGFSSGVNPWTYLLNQAGMITTYLRLAVWPRGLVLNYGWPLPLTVAQALPDGVVVVSLLALTLWALVRYPRWGFLGAWFFVTLAPTSSIVPIATEVGAERRMYLPLIAVVVAAVVGVSRVRGALAAPPARRAGALAGALAVVVVALAAGTIGRNREYASAVELARTTVARHPSSIAHHVLGGALVEAGDNLAGIAELRLALPGAPRAHFTLGAVLFDEGRLVEAIGELQAFVRDQPLLLEAVEARQILGRALAKEERWPEAIEQYRMVLTMNPSPTERVDTRGLLAQALFKQQNYAEAIPNYREYLKSHGDDTGATTGLGISLAAVDRLDEAIAAFRRAVEMDPKNGDNRRNLANALYDRRDTEEAAAQARAAVELRPGDPAAHDLLGRLLAVQGRLDQARAEFERARQIDPANADAGEDLRKLRTVAGAARRSPR